MPSRPSIVSLGEVLWDLFPNGEQFGGAPANFACHAAIAGANVMMVSAVGRDPHGRRASQILESYGVDTSRLQFVDKPTGTVGVELDSRGKPSFTIHEDAAWDYLRREEPLEESIRRVDLLYFGTLGQRCSESRRTIQHCLDSARNAVVPAILDVNLRAPFFDSQMIRESIDRATHLKLSDDELAVVAAAFGIPVSNAAETLHRILERTSLESVVLTCGADGAIWVLKDEVIIQPGIPTSVRDTVGAGDAFTACFAVGLLKGEAHDVILRQACEQAAATCSATGAVPAPPT